MANGNDQKLKELKALLEQNLKYSQDLTLAVKKIQRWILWQKVFIALKWALIIIPLILGVIYLPNIIRDFVININTVKNALDSNLINQLPQ